jgi:hypothetical protein
MTTWKERSWPQRPLFGSIPPGFRRRKVIGPFFCDGGAVFIDVQALETESGNQFPVKHLIQINWDVVYRRVWESNEVMALRANYNVCQGPATAVEQWD